MPWHFASLHVIRPSRLSSYRPSASVPVAWQAATRYNQRSRVKTQMGRWKSVIGSKLKARNFPGQITEVKLGQKVLNKMTKLGRPVFQRIP